jgi:hypothetical protein
MENTVTAERLRSSFFGELDIQIGYCNGMNSNLNFMEYHKTCELFIAATDLIIFLGRVQDIKETQYDISLAESFFIPEGVALELYSTTLHSMPCRMEERGFRCISVLPRGTNSALKDEVRENVLLHSKNKWIIAHAEATQYINSSDQIGVVGENIQIYLYKISTKQD